MAIRRRHKAIIFSFLFILIFISVIYVTKKSKIAKIKAWKLEVRKVFNREIQLNQADYDKRDELFNHKYVSESLTSRWVTRAYERRLLYPPYPEGLDLSKKYIFYRIFRDSGVGIKHYVRSLSGMVMEAQSLQRVLVWSPMIIPGHHNWHRMDLKGPEFIFDKSAALELVETIDEDEFFGRYKRSILNGDEVTWGFIRSLDFDRPSVLAGREEIVLERQFFYEHSMCIDFAFIEEFQQRTWRLPPAPHLQAMADAIVNELPKTFSGVHIRRGDKLFEPWLWPHLDNDTSPQALIEHLPKFIPLGSTVYISTNEFQEGYFAPLKKHFDIKLAQDFKHLFAPGSKFYKTILELAKGDEALIKLDGLQLGLIEYFIFSKANIQVQTFPDLAQDPMVGLPHNFPPPPSTRWISTDSGPFVFNEANKEG